MAKIPHIDPLDLIGAAKPKRSRTPVYDQHGVPGTYGKSKSTHELEKLAAWIKSHDFIEDVQFADDGALTVTHTSHSDGKRRTKRISNLKQARDWLGY